MIVFLSSLMTVASLLMASEVKTSNAIHKCVCAEISVVTSLLPVQEELETCDEETLVLLDIGGTLLIRKDPVLHNAHENWRRMWFDSHYPEMTREEKISLVRVIEESLNSWQVLDNWPELIHKAQHRKAKVVAFTKVLIDPALPSFRGIKLLSHFGLCIQDDLPDLSCGGTQFIYENGVIQTGEKLKGPVLKEVIQRMTKPPSKIVFVDDRKEQVESVKNACCELGIPNVCFHYTAFEKAPLLDEMVANYQLQMLVKEHRWISIEDLNNGEPNETLQ
jgi:hypothetical protein